MSGIFGIVRLDGVSVSVADLEAMALPLAHRGPDGIRYHAGGGVALGHAMLHTTPESLHETLPFRDEVSGLVITSDVRLDNREELIEELSLADERDKVITDSELILHAYLKWGNGCADHLLGDFAFAIWDEKAQQLLCVRDHMGCKPFYYHASDKLFVFSSSAISVARVPEVAATLNEARVADLLVGSLEGVNKTCTFFNEISRLYPAHSAVYGASGLQLNRYWDLQAGPEIQLGSDEEYLEAFTEVYTEAVRCRMRCHTEPVATLSGGLDSSTIVALARKIRQVEGLPPVKTFSGISDEVEGCVESQCSLSVAEQGGVDASFLRVSEIIEKGFGFKRALENLEDPFDTYMAHLAIPCQWASKSGYRVLLDGLDGDLVAGFSMNHPQYLLRQGQWRQAWRESKGLSSRAYLGRQSSLALFLRAVIHWAAPDRLRPLKQWVDSIRNYRCLLKETLICPVFAKRVNLQARLRSYGLEGRPENGESIAAWQKYRLEEGHLTAALERYERVGSYYGVEVRHPLLDKRVVEFCMRLPWHVKTRSGWTKYLMRKLAAKHLPARVAWREGIGIELGWEFNMALLREFDKAEGFDTREIESTTAKYIDSRITFNYTADSIKDYDINTISQWWEMHSLTSFLKRSGLNDVSRRSPKR